MSCFMFDFFDSSADLVMLGGADSAQLVLDAYAVNDWSALQNPAKLLVFSVTHLLSFLKSQVLTLSSPLSLLNR